MDGITKYEGYRLMCETYKKTRWPFFSKVDLIGWGMTDKHLWSLNKEGKIRARDGIQGRIVELIDYGEGNDNRAGEHSGVPQGTDE